VLPGLQRVIDRKAVGGVVPGCEAAPEGGPAAFGEGEHGFVETVRLNQEGFMRHTLLRRRGVHERNPRWVRSARERLGNTGWRLLNASLVASAWKHNSNTLSGRRAARTLAHRHCVSRWPGAAKR